MDIKKTNDVATARLKCLVYGEAGAGKTRLCATVPDLSRALILSAEAGLLSLRDYSIDYVEISSMDNLKDAWSHLKSSTDYDWVMLDSISEIAETCLAAEKASSKDPRKAYGEMADRMFRLLRSFRDLDMHVYMSAKLSRVDDGGRQLFGPSLPGRQLEQGIAYLFDEVFVLHVNRDDEDHLIRTLQCQGDSHYIAKDRSGALELYEAPSLKSIQSKILGDVK